MRASHRAIARVPLANVGTLRPKGIRMKKHVVLAMVMVGVALAACATDDVESVSVDTEEVIGGVASAPGARPWQAQLRVPGYSHYCGGSLVSPRWVLTAGHCVDGRSPGDFTVTLGEHTLSTSDGWEQARTVDR